MRLVSGCVSRILVKNKWQYLEPSLVDEDVSGLVWLVGKSVLVLGSLLALTLVSALSMLALANALVPAAFGVEAVVTGVVDELKKYCN